MFFHILGFDIMLDHKCKPYLLEVNHSPSFSTDSPLDETVKGTLIQDTIRLLGLTKHRKKLYKRNQQANTDFRTKTGKFLRLPLELKEKLRLEFDEVRNEYETQNLGNFEQLLPTPLEEEKPRYAQFLKVA